jgi:DNA-binding beta-propeller fold protein YncE
MKTRVLFVASIAAGLVLMQAAAADTLLVVRKSAGALDFVDPGSGLRLASVPVGVAPHEVSVSPDGRFAVVSNYGTRDQPGSTLSVIDLEQPRELRRIGLAPHTRPHGVAWYSPDRVAVTTEGSAHLLVVDPWTGTIVAATSIGQETSHMVAVAPGGHQAFVANIGSGSLTAVTLDGSAPVRTVATGDGTEGVAVSHDGRQVWATARAKGALVRLDAQTLEVTASVDLPGVPIRVAFDHDGATAYVTCAASAEIVAYDARSGRERGRRRIVGPLAAGAVTRPMARVAPGSPLPIGLAVATDGRSVFVAATMADRIVQLDARTLDVLRTLDVEGEPDGLGVTAVMPKAQCHACEAPAARP